MSNTQKKRLHRLNRASKKSDSNMLSLLYESKISSRFRKTRTGKDVSKQLTIKNKTLLDVFALFHCSTDDYTLNPILSFLFGSINEETVQLFISIGILKETDRQRFIVQSPICSLIMIYHTYPLGYSYTGFPNEIEKNNLCYTVVQLEKHCGILDENKCLLNFQIPFGREQKSTLDTLEEYVTIQKMTALLKMKIISVSFHFDSREDVKKYSYCCDYESSDDNYDYYDYGCDESDYSYQEE